MKIAAGLMVLTLTLLPQAQTPRSGPAPSSSPLPQRMSTAAQTCVPCHGVSGEGKPDAGYPRIAGQSAYYLSKQLDDYADGRRADPTMGSIARGMTRELRSSVAAHYAQQHAEAASRPNTFTASWRERGRALAVYGDLDRGVQACINCHGPSGTGQPPTIPYLAGLDAGYIRRTLEAWQDDSRQNDAGQQMAVIAKALTVEDVAAVARYFAGVAPPKPAPLELLRDGRPQLFDAAMTATMTVGSAASDEPGVESRAPLAGGKEGLGQSGVSNSAGARDAAATGARAPVAGTPGARENGATVAGDSARGRALVAGGAYGCTACHAVPGVRAPSGIAGPRLGGFAQRPFIAGQLPNNLDVLTAFLRDPPALIPQTGMPNVGLGFEDARDIAAFLYTLPAEK